MKNLEHLISKYLSKQTQYSIQLVGPWGRGKTHYYRTVLQDNIASTSILGDETIKYKPIYISLFGLRSIDEVQVKIFHELLYHYFTSKKNRFNTKTRKRLNISTRLIKLILKGYITYKGLQNTNEYETEILDIAKDVIDTTDLVICFDDLERKSKELSIEDFTGYVNSLVEENMKVLIICNENKITEPVYKSFKEKVVGVTYEYNPKTIDVLNNIISNRYTGSIVYKRFLESLSPLLVELSEKNENNYRLLIYALDCLHDIYSIIKKEIIDSKKDFADKCNEEIDKIVKFLLIVAIEFKASRLSYADCTSIQRSIYDFVWSDADGSRKSADKKTPKNKFEEVTFKYYENTNDYLFYNSIFADVTGVKDFDVIEFIDEFKGNYRLIKGEVLPEYSILNELHYWNALKLSDDEYKEKTSVMIEYAKQGKYKLSEYLTIYYYAERFDNPLNTNLQQLREDIINAMSAVAQNKDKLDVESEITLRNSEGYDEEQEQIRQYGLRLLKEAKKEKEALDTQEIIAPFLNNLDNLHDRYHEDERFKARVNDFPVFKMIDIDKFFEKLIQCDPFSIQFLDSFFKERYNRINYSEEASFITEINRKLYGYLKIHSEKTIKTWILKQFQKTLIEIETKHTPKLVG